MANVTCNSLLQNKSNTKYLMWNKSRDYSHLRSFLLENISPIILLPKRLEDTKMMSAIRTSLKNLAKKYFVPVNPTNKFTTFEFLFVSCLNLEFFDLLIAQNKVSNFFFNPLNSLEQVTFHNQDLETLK